MIILVKVLANAEEKADLKVEEMTEFTTAQEAKAFIDGGVSRGEVSDENKEGEDGEEKKEDEEKEEGEENEEKKEGGEETKSE